MTIAACYVDNGGVVFGADSTSTLSVASPAEDTRLNRHLTYGQKIFEVGDAGQGTIGIAMWGLGGLRQSSYRTLIAQWADELGACESSDLCEAANLFAREFWDQYTTQWSDEISHAKELSKKEELSDDEGRELDSLRQNLSGGFCIGGRIGTARDCEAYEFTYGPLDEGPREPTRIPHCSPHFWGMPNIVDRVILGIDPNAFSEICNSDLWHGGPEELIELVKGSMLGTPSQLPLREAIDWVYSSIYTTIKSMKFSHMPPVCGGPVEVALVTSDRPFRWVKHKSLDEAVTLD